jgi:hypothetical protein
MRQAADRRADVIAEALAGLSSRQRDSLVRTSVHYPALVAGVRKAAAVSRSD